MLALEIGGTGGDVPHLVALLELAGVAACYDQDRLASVPVLDVSVSSAIDARTRGGEVRAAVNDVFPHGNCA